MCVIECPERCLYWYDRRAIAYLKKLECYASVVHGCMYGLRHSDGNYMKKPWMLKTNSQIIADGMRITCSGEHKHIPAYGKDCKRAEEYTEEMVRRVHSLFAYHAKHE